MNGEATAGSGTAAKGQVGGVLEVQCIHLYPPNLSVYNNCHCGVCPSITGHLWSRANPSTDGAKCAHSVHHLSP